MGKYKNFTVCYGYRRETRTYTISNVKPTTAWEDQPLASGTTVMYTAKLDFPEDLPANVRALGLIEYGFPAVTITSFDISGTRTNETCSIDVSNIGIWRAFKFTFEDDFLRPIQLINITVSVTFEYEVFIPISYKKVYLGKKQGTRTADISTTIATWSKVKSGFTYIYTGTYSLPLEYRSATAVNSFTIGVSGTMIMNKMCTVSNGILTFSFESTKSSTYSNRAVTANISYPGVVGIPFKVKSTHEKDFDKLANDYIDDSNTTISIANPIQFQPLIDGKIDITFTPVTDEELLEDVENGDTVIRLQAMYHQPSQAIHKDLHYSDPQTYEDEGRGNNHPVWLTDDITSLHSGQFGYVRRFSHKPEYENITWRNLTKAELQSGGTNLQVKVTAPPNDNYTLQNADRFYNVRVEMYCCALHRHGKDPFYYERNGHRKISNRLQYTNPPISM